MLKPYWQCKRTPCFTTDLRTVGSERSWGVRHGLLSEKRDGIYNATCRHVTSECHMTPRDDRNIGRLSSLIDWSLSGLHAIVESDEVSDQSVISRWSVGDLSVISRLRLTMFIDVRSGKAVHGQTWRRNAVRSSGMWRHRAVRPSGTWRHYAVQPSGTSRHHTVRSIGSWHRAVWPSGAWCHHAVRPRGE